MFLTCPQLYDRSLIGRPLKLTCAGQLLTPSEAPYSRHSKQQEETKDKPHICWAFPEPGSIRSFIASVW